MEIRSQDDLAKLAEDGRFSKQLRDAVEGHCLELKEAGLWPYNETGDAEVDQSRVIVVHPQQDDWRATMEVEELLSMEYVEVVQGSEGQPVFRVVKMPLEDVLITYFVQGGVDAEADSWLQRHS